MVERNSSRKVEGRDTSVFKQTDGKNEQISSHRGKEEVGIETAPYLSTAGSGCVLALLLHFCSVAVKDICHLKEFLR